MLEKTTCERQRSKERLRGENFRGQTKTPYIQVATQDLGMLYPQKC